MREEDVVDFADFVVLADGWWGCAE